MHKSASARDRTSTSAPVTPIDWLAATTIYRQISIEIPAFDNLHHLAFGKANYAFVIVRVARALAVKPINFVRGTEQHRGVIDGQSGSNTQFLALIERPR